MEAAPVPTKSLLRLEVHRLRRPDGWYSRLQLAHIQTDWIGPFEEEERALAYWQQRLFLLLRNWPV